jgi:hypothetical protein
VARTGEVSALRASSSLSLLVASRSGSPGCGDLNHSRALLRESTGAFRPFLRSVAKHRWQTFLIASIYR